MRKSLLKHVIALLLLFLGKSVHAQCNGGTIRIVATDSSCLKYYATMKLSGHTTTAGTTYTWQVSNSTADPITGFPPNSSFSTMSATNASYVNSGRDTQNFNSGSGLWYRCLVSCASGSSYSDIFVVPHSRTIGTNVVQYGTILPRSITAGRIQCDTTGNGIDSVVLRITINNPPASDSNYVKSYRWESTVAGGSGYTLVKHTTVDSIKVRFTKDALDYRVGYAICPIANGSWPGGNQATNPVRIGLKPAFLDISARDCPNNEATLSIKDSGMSFLLRDSFKYSWYSASTAAGLNGAGAIGGATASTLKINPSFRQNMYYRATTKLCAADTASSAKDTTNAFQLWVNQGTFIASYDCERDQVSFWNISIEIQ